MSSGIDIELVTAYYQQMSNEEFIQAIGQGMNGLTDEAQNIIRKEINLRKLDPAYIQMVKDQQVAEEPDWVFNITDCPVDEGNRLWIEDSFRLLLNIFGKENTLDRLVLVPERKHFPINYDGSERAAIEILQIIARQMETAFEKITLDFYEEDLQKITEGTPGGMYWGQNDAGHFEISLARTKLEKPEEMIATLAHEIAHIKLLGENKINENDEPLTDLATIFFGLGVFNANAAFSTFADNKFHGWSTFGYLTQMEWGYALALFAHYRQEENPEWVNYLCKNVEADFLQGLDFIRRNNISVIF